MKKEKMNDKGFSLVELIIVIAIIAILAAVAIPKFGEVKKNAALKTDVANAKTIANAVTTLIAEEKLVSTGTIVVKEDSTTKNEVEAYMQNPPSPESKDYIEYQVTVTNGDVSVKMVKKNDTTGVKLFPVADKSVN